MSRKKRSDSKLDALPPHQKKMLRDWLVDENLSYEKARDRLSQDFNVETSVGALSQFYATQCFALRFSQAKSFAEQVEKELLTADPTFDRVTLALIKQKAFERAAAKNGDIDELAKLAMIIGDSQRITLKQREVSISERRITLLEQKAKQADAAKDVTRDETLTPAKREAKLKEIFGLK
jgi:hypothetical protein